MLVVTILNRLDKHKGFVYGKAFMKNRDASHFSISPPFLFADDRARVSLRTVSDKLRAD